MYSTGVNWTSCPTPKPWLAASIRFRGSMTRPICNIYKENKGENVDGSVNYKIVEKQKAANWNHLQKFPFCTVTGLGAGVDTEEGGFSLCFCKTPSEVFGVI